MKRILVISFTDLKKDARVNRQINFLKDDYQVTAAGTNNPDIKGVEFVPLNSAFSKVKIIQEMLGYFLGLYKHTYWNQEIIKDALTKLAGRDFDLIIANDLESLPLALKLKKSAKVLLDAHEYTPKEFDNSLLWRVFYKRFKTWLCREYIKQTDDMLTVCEGIALEYKKVFGVLPHVVTNAPAFFPDIKPCPADPQTIRLVHHGIAVAARKLDVMIEMMQLLDNRFELHFLLMPTRKVKYLNFLKEKAAGNPRIFFHPSVSLPEVVPALSQYDVGIYILEPNSFNNIHALPNKFFDFIQARLCLALSPNPEMKIIVDKYKLGVTASDYSASGLATELNQLTSDKINYFKESCHKNAQELSSENNKKILLDVLNKMLCN